MLLNILIKFSELNFSLKKLFRIGISQNNNQKIRSLDINQTICDINLYGISRANSPSSKNDF